MTGISCIMAGAAGFTPNIVTVGKYVASSTTVWGYAGGQGSVSPSTWPITANTINSMYWASDGSFTTVALAINATVPNSGWSTMTIGGISFSRTAASYISYGGTTRWNWTPPSNPFGTVIGATKVVTWA